MLDKIPDIANTKSEVLAKLPKVGMSEIEVPIKLQLPGGEAYLTMGKADAYVSVDDPESKGIHMSRLFLSLQRLLESKAVNFCVVREALQEFVRSHQGISESAYLQVRFQYPVRRKALLSDHEGWRSYPVELSGGLSKNDLQLQLNTQIKYSSTCPCSAALARQLIQRKFAEDFASTKELNKDAVISWLGSSQGILATPHGQRSVAYVSIRPDSATDIDIDIVDLIDGLEDSLKTAVQTAVKREDEQEFARLNGQNLMFAEDAARRLHHLLNQKSWIKDFRVHTVHHESLHPHNAEAIATKGVLGGLA